MGFKSFVDPTELIIEPGMTGVVGPNGCGKSNLLEALRWVMGETSYKSMRGSSMEDVIFSGTDGRPSRNNAQVTIILDNSKRSAPAEFNDHDEIEITRHIEKDSGSSYRVNGREVRARDIKLLFEDASTGARSHALVRQGQIGEIVNSKPQARRRILEDAAGIAGLHSRRHEAEMRLNGAEANLARLHDLMGQITTQVNSLKRQARQAKKYRELSDEIRKSEALLYFLNWKASCDAVAREEHNLTQTLSAVSQATGNETAAIRSHAEAAEKIQPIRDEEAKRAAALQRLIIERESLEREEQAAARQNAEMTSRLEQLKADLKREHERMNEAGELLSRLDKEEESLRKRLENSDEVETEAQSRRDKAKADVANIEHEHSLLTEQLATLKADHRKYNENIAEQAASMEDLKVQLAEVNSQISELSMNGSGNASAFAQLQTSIDGLATRSVEIEKETLAAEKSATSAREHTEKARDDYESAKLHLRQTSTEVQTLEKLLQTNENPDWPPILDDIKVEQGYETALGAALGEDLDASTNPAAPAHWRMYDGASDAGNEMPPLPAGAEPLSNMVRAPEEIQARLSQIGIIDNELGASLQKLLLPGQRLVSKAGDFWRWDGYTVLADAPLPAAIRLVEKNRLMELKQDETAARAKLVDLEREHGRLRQAMMDAENTARDMRQRWRAILTELSNAREQQSKSERATREANEKLAALTEAGLRIGKSLDITASSHSSAQKNLSALKSVESSQKQLDDVYRALGRERAGLQDAENNLTELKRDNQTARARLQTLSEERSQWEHRRSLSQEQSKSLKLRLEETQSQLAEMSEQPENIKEHRQKLLTQLQQAEQSRQASADELAISENHLKTCQQALRSVQTELTEVRENKARTEAHLEAARERRSELAHLIGENLECNPEECLDLAGHEQDEPIPSQETIERQIHSKKAERDRLGGVNLRAEEGLAELHTRFDDVESERVDLEEAIAKLRSGITRLNAEGRTRLMEAFDEVNAHFKNLFTTLFGGGNAELQLIESDDPLESGLEILACPPGKKPNVMSLLSGGEQALTAMSLIFAVFLTNPSPICVLDEVDAPLDDSNVDRFCNMIREMAESTDTRFLVITHHPMTMARMNRLFGVTMAEKGISQLVSVDLETAEQFREAS